MMNYNPSPKVGLNHSAFQNGLICDPVDFDARYTFHENKLLYKICNKT